MTKRLLFLAALLLPQLVHSVVVRWQRDSGNADGRKKISADQLEATGASGAMAYSLYARRDAFTNEQALLNAAALAYAGVTAEEHRFGFGVGSHYRHEKWERQRTQGVLYPALGFFWSHPRFHFSLSGSESLTKIALSGLFAIALPVEFNSEFEALESQPYRWSVNAFVFASRYGGLIAGVEPLAQRARAGFWLSPAESLRLSVLSRLSSSETFWELALSFTFSVPEKDGELPRLHADTAEKPTATAMKDEPTQKLPKRKRVPAFALLVQWGLTPTEALQFTRQKDICALSAAARQKLAAKNWICYEDA